MINFAMRNIKIYFRDKSAVFFSLLSVFIIVGLYALFLGDVMNQGLSNLPNPQMLTDTWIMAGLLSVTSFTTTMGAFGTMVEDRVKKVSKDFSASPMKRSSMVGGYILSSFVIGILMCLVSFVLLDLYLLINDGVILSLMVTLQVFGLIVITTLANTSLIFFITSLFHSQNAFTTASIIIGTLIGFITGIYLPIGNFPEGVQMVIKLFPISYSASLFRQVVMAEPLAVAFAGAPSEYLAGFNHDMGVTFSFGSYVVTPLVSISILLVTSAVFYALSLITVSRKQK
ncbi:MAG: ABC transporter permease [Firmicutes bacterium]|nr:ABC transporter permease [Bacillota bacterium]